MTRLLKNSLLLFAGLIFLFLLVYGIIAGDMGFIQLESATL